MPSSVQPRHPKYRTKLCRNLAGGDCPFGEKCSFIHPAPSTNPSSSAPAPHLFNRNPLLLPQLLTLFNQQGAEKKTPQGSPPRSQVPQLVDEGPSPANSLLLSNSDSTSSEQTPQTRKSSKRKKYPCRHFVRTGGWCPAGEHCRFHHDVATLPSEGVRKTEQAPPCDTDVPTAGGGTIGGGVLMGSQSPSPPTVSQAQSEAPRYTEAEPMQSYQPMYWPHFSWQPYRPYYPAVHIPLNAPPSVVQRSVYPPPQPRAQNVPTSQTQTRLPLGSYEVHGTTYFPTSMPSVPARPRVTYPIPLHPAPYNHTMASAYPYYPPPTRPAGYYDIPRQTKEVAPQTSFDPFASDPVVHSELPVIPRLEDYQISPVQQDVLPLPLSSPPALSPNGNLGLTTPPRQRPVTPEHEFPYRPPKDQQVGRARRICVTIRKHSRVNSS